MKRVGYSYRFVNIKYHYNVVYASLLSNVVCPVYGTHYF
jgi:hypothetical protein